MTIPAGNTCSALSRGSLFWVLLCSLIAGGCKKDDMAQQTNLRTYEPTAQFTDGTEARPLVAGVIARPPRDTPGIPYADQWAVEGSDKAQGDTIPLPVTPELIRRGEERYNIYCSVCHGRIGDGRGMIVQRGFVPPPSYHNDRLSDPKQTPDSHLYDVISNGRGAMFSYAERVRPDDRWAIVAYIRVLQQAVKQAVKNGKLSEKEYADLKGVRP